MHNKIYLNKLALRWASQIPEPGEYNNISINSGAALYAMYLSSIQRYFNICSFEKKILDHLNYGFELTQTIPLSSSFYSSLPGFTWLATQLNYSQLITKTRQIQQVTDELSLDVLSSNNQDLLDDVISGTVGLIFYLLSRCKSDISNSKRKTFQSTISTWTEDRLHRIIQYDGHHNKLNNVKIFDSNLGIAHGYPALITVGCDALNAGLINQRVASLLNIAINKLCAETLTDRSGNERYIPYIAGGPIKARLGWCYGSLSIIPLLLSSAHLSNEYNLIANAMLRGCINQYKAGEGHLDDASLCHGYSGVAFLLKEILSYKEIDRKLKEEVKKIIANAFECAKNSEIIINNRYVFPCYAYKHHKLFNNSFLNGGYGIVLALCATKLDIFTPWKKIILLK